MEAAREVAGVGGGRGRLAQAESEAPKLKARRLHIYSHNVKPHNAQFV